MKKEPLIFIGHILENIKDIENFSKGLSKRDLERDTLRQKGVIRSLEIIGEATKNVNQDFREKHPKVEWKKIAGLRDKLIHHYFKINLNLVWDIIKEDLPILKKQIKEILEKEK